MPELRGFEASAPGTYVLLEDVIATIREYAQSLDDPNSGAAIHELASWFAAGQDPRNVTAEEPQDVVASEQEHDPAANRIELYPEETPRGIRWYARSVDAEGTILRTTAGSFDYDYVYKDAGERWPDLKIYQVNEWSDDSVFMEQQEKMASPTSGPLRERISPKRMYGT